MLYDTVSVYFTGFTYSFECVNYVLCSLSGGVKLKKVTCIIEFAVGVYVCMYVYVCVCAHTCTCVCERACWAEAMKENFPQC